MIRILYKISKTLKASGFWGRHGLKISLILVGFVLIIVILSNYVKPGPIVMGFASDSLSVEQEPLQSPIETAESFEIQVPRGTFTVTPLAHYSIAALVVSKKKYSTDWNAQLAPFDLALAWGDLALPENNRQVKYEQYSRWYRFKVEPDSSLSIDYIYKHSANTHLIPANSNVHRAIEQIQEKDVVLLEGYLVNLKGTYKNRTYFWNSSTSRADTGNGSCEVLYVKRIQIEDRIYE